MASRDQLRAEARRILADAWRVAPDGSAFCVPHSTTYPWQWLWDSCFHAVVWTHLGEDRGVAELLAALRDQDGDGFVPHLRYATGASPHADLWGRPTTSSITQPPMYGHAIAELARAGVAVPDELVDRALRGIEFLLLRRRRSPAGLVELCHPWESGCDDSPRWDDALAGPWSPSAWFAAKGDLLRTIQRTSSGAPIANPAFAVGSVGFSALVAWNALELATVTAGSDLRAEASSLVEALEARWEPSLATWVDDGPTSAGSGRVRTLDSLLPLLVLPCHDVFDLLVDAEAFGAPFGPRGMDAREPTYDPTRYWRGPAWPQLTYLSWVASTRGDASAVSEALVRSMTAGALRSGFAEYWDPETGEPLGAVPQSWTALSCVMADV
ncbi:MAG: MGH1-like glycoside hydrolase domain-containing protein [Actinomycetota bacterium]